jgi:pimeloyl-ACP methyl ester carboxylesterase/membrane protein DedA with SNARE-associated domain
MRRHPWLAAYGLALALSWAVRLWPHAPDPTPPGVRTSALGLAYEDSAPTGGGGDPVVLLLHGSPGGRADLARLATALGSGFRTLRPDLPGFGLSGAAGRADASARANARALLGLLDELGVERVHVVGFSLGGASALELWDAAPSRVASVSLVSSIGVVELELLGDARSNHALHMLQLALVRAVDWLVPHFGTLDGAAFGIGYARSFADTDQRRLRPILSRIDVPVRIVHGSRDFLVPAAAAREHARLVPQSELEVLDATHFLPFLNAPEVGAGIADFAERVEGGRAVDRAHAAPDRLEAAARPFDPHDVPPAMGPALVLMCGLLAIGTLVSEDLSCVAAGVLVSAGRISFGPAAFACFAGIYLGDLGLFFAGRALGRPALARAPLRWFVSEASVERGSAWLERRGLAVIALSRLVPGTRLPTYFAAGLLRTRASLFAGYFALASALWTPALVGAAALFGETPRPLGAALFLLIALRLAPSVLTHRGRRLLVGRWRRLRRWEYWPLCVFYLPIGVRIARLALRHRSLLLPSAVNPGIRGGGFAGERKHEIFAAFRGPTDRLLRSALVPCTLPVSERIARARDFIARESLAWPVVLKPDVGERGSGVVFARSPEDVADYLTRSGTDALVQEYAPGNEFGIFYVRHPDAARGRIFSITEKVLPAVTGDGHRTLERLILDDERAVCMAARLLERFASRLEEVPAPGEMVRLVELGTHSQGAVFLDGWRVFTPELEASIDALSRQLPGFHFGRFDLRARSIDELRAGRGFKVLELNGLTAEAAHIYDPRNGIADAYRVMFEQWRLAFEIAAANRATGAAPLRLRDLLRLLRERREARALTVSPGRVSVQRAR